MITILFGIYIFFDILGWLIIIDVILSWLAIFGLNIRPKFLINIINPIYSFIKNKIPTTIGMMDFAPIIIIFLIYFCKGLLLVFFPELTEFIQLYSNIL